ncbi:MAG: HEAT repeat domain-containing protein, partial [Thermoplasmata archaeon]|nr:HEAT repeat domain-containing protein [Thermoplasmata archaeon]
MGLFSKKLTSDDVEKMREQKDVQGLIRALYDRGKDVRGRAAEALGEIGDPRAVPALIEALND